MDPSSARALGRLALLLRWVGVVWLVLLAMTSSLAGQMVRPAASWAIVAGAALWAVVCTRARLLAGLHGRWWVLAIDLATCVGVVLGPQLLGEDATFSGGYPFAALVIGLAVAGRRGLITSAALLAGVTIIELALSGLTAVSTTVSSVLFYVLVAASLDVGWRLLHQQQQRAQLAEAALAVERERAVTAAHLHDSVLQTLALVHRRADEADTIRSLVRRQERELREWLFGDAPTTGTVSLRKLLEENAEQVQADTGVAVRVVTVGGAGDTQVPADDDAPVRALVRSAREAVRNAAIHAGVERVDVFAERADDALVVFVRDRGRGFDVDAVAADRQGVRGSILSRMQRAGGVAVVRSEPGRGTEVELRL